MSGSRFFARFFVFVSTVVALSYEARALPSVQSVVSRSTSDDSASMTEDALADCFLQVIEGTDCEDSDTATEDSFDYTDLFVEIIINDTIQYNIGLEQYCQEDPTDHSDRSDESSGIGRVFKNNNNCPDIPYVLRRSKGCGFVASHIESEHFTVRFYYPADGDEDLMKCSSNISEETIYKITKSKHNSYIYITFICAP